jgi:hypothetical protein
VRAFDCAQDGCLAGAGIAHEQAQEIAASQKLRRRVPLTACQFLRQAVSRAEPHPGVASRLDAADGRRFLAFD